MLISPRLAVLSTILTASSASANKERSDFMTAMKSSLGANADVPTSAIREKILQKAIYLPPNSTSGQRSLSSTTRRLSDDGYSYTDYYSTSTTFSNAFGFDPTRFSLSYSRCAQVRQFDDYVAAREDTKSVFSTKHFAIFRFCSSKTCDPYAAEQKSEEDANGQQQNGQSSGYMGMNFATYQGYIEDKYKQYSYVNAQNKQAAADQFKEIEGQFEVGGARGAGCSSNYGEYMIELEDYLEIMSDYISGRFSEYCKYCEKCMYNEYQNWAKNQGRDLFDISEEGWRNLEFERELGGCGDYDKCRYYANTCNAGLDDGITDYFQCTSMGDVYVGPHCAEDGVSITLGAYADEDCNEFLSSDMLSVTGENVDQEAFDNFAFGNLNALMPEGYQEKVFEEYGGWESMCIPCADADASLWNGVNDATSINELCLNLYESSARCDHYYNNYQSKSKSIGLYDKERMSLSCAYIDKAKMGNYDEAGVLSIPEGPLIKSGLFKDSQYYDQAYPYMAKVNGWQIFGLIASLLAVIVLGIWSIKLHRSLTKKGQWRPRRINKKSSLAQPVAMSRPDSGIGMARQQSGASYYMT